MSDPPVRLAPGVPFALRFIGLGMGVFAIGILITLVTGGEVRSKNSGEALGLLDTLRLVALLAIGGGGLWWGGGRLRRLEDADER